VSFASLVGLLAELGHSLREVSFGREEPLDLHQDIAGLLRALMREPGPIAEQTSRYVNIIGNHAHQLNAIIDDLPSLSRLEDGAERRAISFENQKLKGVLVTVIDLSPVKAEQKQMKVNPVCTQGAEAPINALLLEQAVVNLMDNAAKYSEPGTVVKVHVDQRPDETAISIKDAGCGIPAEHLSRVFQRFYVVDKSRRRKLGGTGLGLAIVKHIARVYRGYVTAQAPSPAFSSSKAMNPDLTGSLSLSIVRLSVQNNQVLTQR